MQQLELKKTIYFIIIFICLIFSYVNFKSYTSTFDHKLREYLFELRGEVETTNQIIIVDIDEKSIQKLGQWPFPRDYMAQALINLTNSQIGMMGMDIIFSEFDRSSPSHMAEVLGVQGNFQNNDIILGQVLASTPTILGYFFTEDKEHTNKEAPLINAKIQRIDENNQKELNLITSKGVVQNISYIQEAAYSSGFFNAYNSSHGKITKMPMLLSYKDKIYPSLSLEMIRIALSSPKIELLENEFGLYALKLNDLHIPVDKNGFMNINFRGAKSSFKYYSFVDIVEGNFKPEDVAGKIALFGTSAITLADLRAMVYDLAIPGVEIHANIIDNILIGDFLYEPSFALAINTITIFILTILLGLIYLRVNALSVIPLFIVICISLCSFYYHLLFTKGIILDLFYPLMALILTTVVAQILNYSKESEQKQLIKDKFSKKVSLAVVNDLLSQKDNQFKGVKKEVTIFFSDIRDFTPLSEKLNDPQELIKVLNLYMEPMSNEIIKTKGTIDKFIGDAIMAYWNAPQDIKNHADCAVKTALLQLKVLKELNKQLNQKYKINIDIGIGLHTGFVTVGEMGSKGRSDYTIIGDNVNLASRVEGLTKKLGAKILITDSTKEKLKDEYIFKELAYVEVKGKTNAVLLYEVISFKNQKPKNFDEINAIFTKALDLYKRQEFKEAKDLFIQCEKIQTHKINEFYIEACNKYLNNKKESFNIAFSFTSK